VKSCHALAGKEHVRFHRVLHCESSWATFSLTPILLRTCVSAIRLSFSLDLLVVKLFEARDVVSITFRVDEWIRLRTRAEPLRLCLHVVEACMWSQKYVAVQALQDRERSCIDSGNVWPGWIVQHMDAGIDRHAAYEHNVIPFPIFLYNRGPCGVSLSVSGC